jgi:hypothetical protein
VAFSASQQLSPKLGLKPLTLLINAIFFVLKSDGVQILEDQIYFFLDCLNFFIRK